MHCYVILLLLHPASFDKKMCSHSSYLTRQTTRKHLEIDKNTGPVKKNNFKSRNETQ